MTLDSGKMTLGAFIVDSLTLPFCHPAHRNSLDPEFHFPCGLTFATAPELNMDAENQANILTEKLKFAHAKHHIDGHNVSGADWQLIMDTVQVGDRYLHDVWCSCA
jgi:hypothetical protein